MTRNKKSGNNSVEILIAEDSRTQAEQLQHLLEEHGFTVRAASNGKEALAAARKHKPTIIISDVMMPEMDGYALCKALKTNESLRDIPIILVTMLSKPQDVIRGLQSGADNFIRKPYDEKYLLSRIRYILANKELRKSEKMQIGVELFLGGEKHFIDASRQQMLDLLISTYEEAVHMNGELKVRERQLARSYESLSGLYKIADGLNQSMTVNEVCEKALTRAAALPGVQAGWISLREGETEFRIGASHNLPPALEKAGAFKGDCLCRRKLLSGELDSATNILECERLQKSEGDTRGLHYHASIPLWSGDRTLGIMNLVGSQKGIFSEEDLDTLYAVGNQVGIALERAFLLENMERLVEQRTAALKESELWFQAVFHSQEDAVAVVSTNRKMIDMNAAAKRMFGYSQEEVKNQSTELFYVDHDDYVEFGKRIFEAFSRNEASHFEFRLKRKSGEVFPTEHTVSLLKNDAGESLGIVSVIRDITERKNLEAQLVQAQKMEAIGKLAGGVAHDFNNILTTITGYSDLMLMRLRPEDPLRKMTEEMKKAAARGASLTRQLLAFSRRQMLELKVLDLNEVVSNVDSMLRRLIGEDIDLLTVLEPNLGRVKADHSQMEQVLMNLAVNSRDAMPKGGKLTIQTSNVEMDESYANQHVVEKPGRYVMLAVSDTGHGMDANTKAHIFEPFFTTKEKGKGTGLGLATVYGIVKQSGGHIWVYSEPGQGATFKIFFPRVEEASDPAQRDAALPATTKVRTGTETVLLVEDEEVVRALTREVLEMHGYTVLESKSGREALSVCEKHAGPIHLMVTDVVMPQINGRELAQRVASLRPDMRVLFLSGYTDDAIVHHGVLEPDAAFLQKPFSPDALARKVRDVLDRRKP